MKSKNKILLGLALGSTLLGGGPNVFAQTEKAVKSGQNNLIENFENMSHKDIVQGEINTLIGKYGRERAQEIVRDYALIEINRYRKEIGISEYKKNEILEKGAQKHADDMSKNDYFNHKSPDGKHVWERIDTNKYDYKYLGENISNDNNIVNVIRSYFQSKTGGHEDIFEGKYEDIGIGLSPIIHIDTDYPKYYFVFNFGKTF